MRRTIATYMHDIMVVVLALLAGQLVALGDEPKFKTIAATSRPTALAGTNNDLLIGAINGDVSAASLFDDAAEHTTLANIETAVRCHSARQNQPLIGASKPATM